MASPNESELSNPPQDTISAVHFSANGHFLLVSSWDSVVRLYDAKANTLQGQYRHPMGVLDCCFADVGFCYSGGLDSTVRGFDFNTNTDVTLGQHDDTIKCIKYCNELGVLLTGSWDKTIQIWDPRQRQRVSVVQQPDKVYAMGLSGESLVVGTANRRVWIWDLRNMSYAQQRRESSLKFQTRCLETFPNKQGYALGSIEGRVAIEYMDPSPEVQKQRYAFKCHRVKDATNNTEFIYPLHSIAFHEEYNTFATGGGDGFVNIWDGFNKKRLCQFHKYPSSISALSFSNDGSLLAIASSYMREDGEKSHPGDSIFIRKVADNEVKPNTKPK
ncbi:mitotic checkpoint protein BUB3-like [Sycon ciliatum]|uniref:mitotic checkpoint protein BUB3-like n=1 Tax=Sycon ciliatum TaxID=27933 RepID=UPI0020AB6194|eukprot:scpid65776/ scgid23056/ Mitotic checkpoint protein BUB3 &gt; Mitotic checkpoint protein BUB3; WD repeat type I transmembrane protein A72.5